MTRPIRPDQIRDLSIFDMTGQNLELCPNHTTALSKLIATDVNTLVQSPFFQKRFASLFPAPENRAGGAHLNIQLTNHSLIVQLMRQDAATQELAPRKSSSYPQSYFPYRRHNHRSQSNDFA